MVYKKTEEWWSEQPREGHQPGDIHGSTEVDTPAVTADKKGRESSLQGIGISSWVFLRGETRSYGCDPECLNQYWLQAGNEWDCPVIKCMQGGVTQGLALTKCPARENLGKTPAICHFLPIKPSCPWDLHQGAVFNHYRSLLPPESHSDTSTSHHPPGV